MSDKPTYEELAKRVNELEREKLQASLTQKSLIKSDEWLSDKIDFKKNAENYPEELDLGTIINVEEIQAIMDDFCALTNMVTAILDVKGNVIESTGWQDICTKFHYKNPQARKNCSESELLLAKSLKRGEYVDYKCKNGLTDVVTPLYVGSRHLGNVYTGQFFYEDEEVDEEVFVKQAKKFGFDKESYIEALRKVPKYSRKKIDHLMGFLVKLTTYISRISLVNIKLENEINDRKQAEMALLESEKKYQTLFNMSPIGLALCKINGDLVDVNPAYAKIIGQSVEEVLKLSYWDITPKKYEELEKQQLQSLESRKFYGPYEKEYIHKDGHLVPVRLIGQLIEQDGEKMIWSSVEDITEQKKLERQVFDSQKMESIGNLAGGIAHDFNNLLSPILGMSEMLLEDLPNDSLEHENANEIFNAGKRAGDLVKQILAFSRQSEHKVIPTRIQSVIKEVLKLSRSTIPVNIEINENIQPNTNLVMADPTQIHQVAMNLITNALHAVEEKNGVIDIELKEIELKENEIPESALKAGKYIRFSVSDNGIGISQNTMNKIFEPYFTTKEQGKGTGLGLAVVYGIVKEHNGEINVYSEVGKGTTFNVYLPLMKKTTETFSTELASEFETGSESILLVDDEVSVAKLEGQMLSRLGYKVTVKNSSHDALNTFRLAPDSFDLVISDMTMPNMTGDQLAKKILSIRAETPIVICTGFSERINKEKAKMIGVKGFLMKPVLISDLSKMVRKVIGESKNG